MTNLICPELHPDHYVNKRCELDFSHPGMHRNGVMRWGNYTGSYSAPVDNGPTCKHGPMVEKTGVTKSGRAWGGWFCTEPYDAVDACKPVAIDKTEPEDLGDESLKKEGKMFDVVSKPEHYNTHPSGIEPILITKHMPFCEGNVIKYVMRAPYKGAEVQDLKKAQQYLSWAIEMAEARANAEAA